MPLWWPPFTGTAVTLFDLMHVGGIIGGIWVGITMGDRISGVTAAVIGGILGFVAGHFVGGIVPWYIGWVVFDLLGIRRRRTEVLRNRLQTGQYMADRLIAEMIIRGEPVESFWPYILSSLRSDSFYERAQGWDNLEVWFPRIAKQIEGFRPQDSVEACRRYVAKIENAEPCAAPLPRESDIKQSRPGSS